MVKSPHLAVAYFPTSKMGMRALGTAEEYWQDKYTKDCEAFRYYSNGGLKNSGLAAGLPPFGQEWCNGSLPTWHPLPPGTAVISVPVTLFSGQVTI